MVAPEMVEIIPKPHPYDGLTVRAITDNGEIRVAWSDLEYWAERREKLHTGHVSNRPLSERSEYIGLTGEWKFALDYDLVMDLRDRAGGDDGTDFPLKKTVDVKTARKPYNLGVEVGKKAYAEIFVLAGYDDRTDTAYFVGWEYRSVMLECEQGTFRGHDVVNYIRHSSKLHPMSELERILGLTKCS